MNILYLVPDLFGPPGGIARYCWQVSRALLEAGIGLNVVALNDTTEAEAEIANAFAGMDYQPCHGSHKKFLQAALVESACRRPAIILVGHANFAILGWFLARLFSVPFVTWAYGVEAWRRRSGIQRWALQRSDQVIAISHFTARRTAQANEITWDKLLVLHNCLDPDWERLVRSEPSISNPSLLTVARICLDEGYKGHDYVISAMPTLLARFPELIYHIVGDGDGRSSLKGLVEQVGVTRAVRFHGIVSDEELVRHYSESSVFIMPSRREGFGFVFIEAMSQGTPVIGGNVDATTEVVVDGETGYLVNPTSVDAIAEAVSRLLADDALRRRMGQAARNHVRENFSFAGFQEQLLTYLSELV